jgi:putative FmdB family regulatory protein
MPIYPYLCGSCGHHQDVLQKMSAAPLTTCPECNAETFSKQLSAPAFQLKGSGWYVTDFRENGKKPEGAENGEKAGDKASDGAAAATATPAAGAATPAAAGAASSASPAAPAATPAPAPAAAPPSSSPAPSTSK